MWRFRGTPYYLKDQAERLGASQILIDRARNNAEIYRVSVLLSQLCERYYRAREQDGVRVFEARELDQIKAALVQCEMEVVKLHALAASAAAMLDEAWLAFGLDAPQRPYAILSDHDRPPELVADANGRSPKKHALAAKAS